MQKLQAVEFNRFFCEYGITLLVKKPLVQFSSKEISGVFFQNTYTIISELCIFERTLIYDNICEKYCKLSYVILLRDIASRISQFLRRIYLFLFHSSTAHICTMCIFFLYFCVRCFLTWYFFHYIAHTVHHSFR